MTTPRRALHDYEYLQLLEDILDNGINKGDRTGTGTRSLFGRQIRFDLAEGFPLLTTKKLPFRWIAEELLWFLSGSTDEKDLRARGVDIWKEWATEEQCGRFGRREGDLGPVYGHQWRNFGATPEWGEDGAGGDWEADGVDQIANAIGLLQNSPDSRRIIVSGWNPREATDVALPPCHTLFQFETHIDLLETRRLSCHMYQRSADVFLGVPWNVASYALLVHMFARVLDYQVGELIISFGDVHIYQNHIEQVHEQLLREASLSPTLTIPELPLPASNATPLDQLLALRYEDLRLHDYNPQPKIAAPVAI
jgi:thymidylate synthase